MAVLFHAIRCLACEHEMEPDPFLGTCQRCGHAWLEARYRIDALPADWPHRVAQRPTSMWRYRELLPFPTETAPVSLGEGWTPLTPAGRLADELAQTDLWFKDERQHPTGSFKDRQAAATVTALQARGIDELVLASTGNAAAAYAAFCARAAIKLWVFLTSSVPAEKMRELALYGAEVIKITGTYDQAKRIAADFAARRGLFFDQGARAIPGRESMKTIAYEIAEQSGWQAPDWYVQAVSGGIGPLGVVKGFEELHEAGLIDRVPKLGIVQVEGCAPMVRAWEAGHATAAPVPQPDTLITVLATGDPGPAYTLLKRATDRHGGAMLAVSDGDAFRAMRRVARTEGLSVEPAASVAFAGLEKLIERGHVQPGERVVVNCSGHTFSAEKHALEDRYVLHLETSVHAPSERVASGVAHPHREGLTAALTQLDEQVTTIVIIDDNPHDSRLIRRLLQSYKSYRVFEAYNGPDGLDLVRQRQPDLVVLDLAMPEMDGFTVLAELKADARTRAIPVMIISAKSLTGPELQRLRQQTDSVWQKGSFNARDLLQHVVETLGSEDDSIVLPPTPDRPTPRIQWAGPDDGPPARPLILVVEDNVLEARLLRRLFEASQRFEVVEAHSRAEALNRLRARVPDLIVLDLVLPDGKGEELLATIRDQEATRDVPVIVVSARTIDPPLRHYLAEQADSVWEKGSMDRNSLLARVETMLVEQS